MNVLFPSFSFILCAVTKLSDFSSCPHKHGFQAVFASAYLTFLIMLFLQVVLLR